MLMNSREKDLDQKGFATSAVFAMIMSLAFVLALGFGIWAFAGMQENKSNLDEKIEAASAVAVQEAESAKDVEFAEELKNPFDTFRGRDTYGSLTFEYPKTWSVYAEQEDRSTILEFYGHPDIIPGIDRNVSYAFRAQILSNSYDSELKKFNNAAERGEVEIKAYRPQKVQEVLGALINGEVATNKSGRMVIFPLRDKTVKIWTEQETFVPDFEKVIESMTFVP